MDIKDYPTTTEDARAALQTMQSTHAVQLMQAHDIDGKLIMPADYVDKLRGACAWVRFTLEKFTFKLEDNRSRDTFVADIESIRVVKKSDIASETPQPSPSKKRKVIYKMDPLTASGASKGKGKGKERAS
jgi:hypothetical protein